MKYQIIRLDDDGTLSTTVNEDVEGIDAIDALISDMEGPYGEDAYRDGDIFLVIALNTNGAHHDGALFRVERENIRVTQIKL